MMVFAGSGFPAYFPTNLVLRGGLLAMIWGGLLRARTLWGIVTLPCEERERTAPQRFSGGRDDLAPCAHRRRHADALCARADARGSCFRKIGATFKKRPSSRASKIART
jgi:hypothetical protein